MKSKRNLFTMALMTLVLVCFGTAQASEVARIYLEFYPKDRTTTVWPTEQGKDYLRGRIVLLDEDNNLADTFNGADIQDATLTVQSQQFGADVRFAQSPATDLNAIAGWQTPGADNTVELDITDAWVEFAVSYDNISEVGDDTIVAALTRDGLTTTSEADIVIELPVANTYAVRVGGVVRDPENLEVMPPRKMDNGAVKEAGLSVTVDVFSVFGRDTGSLKGSPDNTYDTLIFTDNVPEGMEKFGVTGSWFKDMAGAHAPSVTIVNTSGTLENGRATLEVMVDDLHIPEIMAEVASQAGTATATGAKIMDALVEMDSYLSDGVPVMWYASSTMTREVGRGDVFDTTAGGTFPPLIGVMTPKQDVIVNNDKPLVNVRAGKDAIGVANVTFGFGLSTTPLYPEQWISKVEDYSKHKPGPAQSMTIAGLPISTITGTFNGWFGFQDVDQANAQDVLVSPLDAWLYNPAYPPASTGGSTFAVPAGDSDDKTPVLGAILGFDSLNNPAALPPSFKVFSGGGSPDGDSFAGVGYWADYNSETGILSNISQTALQSAFMPFAVAGSLDSVYVQEPDGAMWASHFRKAVEMINGLSEAVNFVQQDNVRSLTVTGVEPGLQAGTDSINIQLGATGDETSFTLRAVARKGDRLQVNKQDATTADDSVAIPSTGTNTAEQDVVFFTALSGDTPFLLFSGNKGTQFIQPIDLDQGVGTTFNDEGADGFTYKNKDGIVPEDPDVFPPVFSAIALASPTVIIDKEHPRVSVTTGNAEAPTIAVVSKFGNLYIGNAFPSDAKPEVAVVKRTTDAETGESTDDPFPGATATVDQAHLIMEFDLAEITADNDDPILQLTAGTTAEVPLHLRALKQTVLEDVFVPILGVDETPICLYFADQDGLMVEPVTSTWGDTVRPQGTFDVVVNVDNNTNTTYTLTTNQPKTVFNVKPVADQNIVKISADGSDAGAGIADLELPFAPDLTAPQVQSVESGNCRTVITVTDNQAVDLARARVTVRDSSNNDITDQLERTDAADTTTGTIILSGFPEGSDVYGADIVAFDAANNITRVTRFFAVSCTIIPPECVDVDPSFSEAGTSRSVTIQAANTGFINGVTQVAFSCPSVTVDSVTVNSATELTVDITIAADAENAVCGVTVTTGTEELVCGGAFEIITEPPSLDCTSVSPSEGDAGDTLDVTISLEASGLVIDSTTPNASVDFQCSGVTVLSTEVVTDDMSFRSSGMVAESSTANLQVNARISIDAEAADCTGDVSVSIGDLEAVCTDAFTVNAEPIVETCEVTMTPDTIVSARVGAHVSVINLAVSDGTVSRSSEVTFESGGILPVIRLPLGNRLLIIAMVRGRIAPGTYTVTVDECEGEYTIRHLLGE